MPDRDNDGSAVGVFTTRVRRTRAALVAVALLAAGAFFIVLAFRWNGSESQRQYRFASDVAVFAAVGVANIAAGMWAAVSAARSQRVVLDLTGINAGRKHVAWTDVVDVTVQRKTMFLSFGQSLLLTVSTSTTTLAVDLFRLSCASDEFAMAFDGFAEKHGIDLVL